ncbi:MAG: phosphate ABC transporter permease PstA [Veillonellaceae bacterium]|nr:phosphate ABC transporter permease PstA [Veillonellaceae bacterium]
MNEAARGPYEYAVRIAVGISLFLTLGSLAFLLGHILYNGIPFLTADFFSYTYTTTNMSLFPALVTTVYLTLGALALAVPLGLGTAVYMTEYADRRSLWVTWVRSATEALAGIPSIVYGLFGFLFFVQFFRMGYSLLAGILTMTIMILPFIIKTAEEALLAVSRDLREGSYGLGVGKKDTVLRIVLPSAGRGILAGVVLGIGRIVGETVALMYTIGTVAEIPADLWHSGRTLSIHMYALSGEGIHTDKAYATGVILILLVIAMNTVSDYVVDKWRK